MINYSATNFPPFDRELMEHLFKEKTNSFCVGDLDDGCDFRLAISAPRG